MLVSNKKIKKIIDVVMGPKKSRELFMIRGKNKIEMGTS
jgi:hypothetical protein